MLNITAGKPQDLIYIKKFALMYNINIRLYYVLGSD